MKGYKRLQGIGQRTVWLLFALSIAIPLVRPVFMPLTVSTYTQAVYDFVETLEPGDRVLFQIEYGMDMGGDLTPPLEALTRHILSQDGVAIIFTSTYPDGPQIAQNTMNKLASFIDQRGLAYGKDWVNLGFAPMTEGTVAATAQDFQRTWPADVFGAAVSELEACRGILTARDLALTVNFSGGGLGVLPWVRQVSIPFGTPHIIVCTQVVMPSVIPFIDAKQVVGLVSGLRGSAEYEALTLVPGMGTAGMSAQSMSTILFLLLIVLSNVGHFWQRHAEQTKGAMAR